MLPVTKSTFKPLARLGYAARGVVYAVIGFFAALAAIGAGQPMDSRQALGEVLASGFGSVLAYALVAALLCYAAWRVIQAVFDTDRHGHDVKGTAIRSGLLASAVVYVTLAFYAWSLHGQSADAGGEGGGFAQTLAGVVGSRWAAAIIAAILTGVAVAHGVKALRETYAKRIEAGPGAMAYIHPVAKTGLIARGAVFLTLAFLFALRAWRAEGSGETPGTKEALEFLQSLPAGWLLLALMGVGLVCFSIYSFVEAAFRRINIEDARAG